MSSVTLIAFLPPKFAVTYAFTVPYRIIRLEFLLYSSKNTSKVSLSIGARVKVMYIDAILYPMSVFALVNSNLPFNCEPSSQVILPRVHFPLISSVTLLVQCGSAE